MADRMSRPPSPKQLDLLCHLYRFRHKYGYSPTLDELGHMMGVSKVTVHQYVRALEHKGLIRRLRKHARSMEIVDEAQIETLLKEDEPCWKLVGRLNAGNGKLKFYTTPKKFEPELLVQRYRKASLLRVIGTSAPELGICEGDYLLIEPFHDKQKSRVALVQVAEDCVELCRFYQDEGRLFVHANDGGTPIRIRRADILALVIGLLRSY